MSLKGLGIVKVDTYNGKEPTLTEVLNVNMYEYPGVLDRIIKEEGLLRKDRKPKGIPPKRMEEYKKRSKKDRRLTV